MVSTLVGVSNGRSTSSRHVCRERGTTLSLRTVPAVSATYSTCTDTWCLVVVTSAATEVSLPVRGQPTGQVRRQRSAYRSGQRPEVSLPVRLEVSGQPAGQIRGQRSACRSGQRSACRSGQRSACRSGQVRGQLVGHVRGQRSTSRSGQRSAVSGQPGGQCGGQTAGQVRGQTAACRSGQRSEGVKVPNKRTNKQT